MFSTSLFRSLLSIRDTLHIVSSSKIAPSISSGVPFSRGHGSGRLAILLVLCVHIAACGGPAPDGKTIQWQPCTSPAFHEWLGDRADASTIQCGHIYTPLVYGSEAGSKQKDDSDNVDLAITRLPALGERKGSLVLISGGPGIPGIDLPLNLADDENIRRLRQSYDIIGYDPRGVGHSRPNISCELTDTPAESGSANNSIAAIDAASSNLVAACFSKMGSRALAHMGSRDAARDLDVIRQALGERKLSALAYSYGTSVAALYAEQYPGNVRALVLDGVVDLSEDSFASDLHQAQSGQASFERFIDYCRKLDECPFKGDSNEARRSFRQLLQQLDDKPLETPGGRRVAGNDVLEATQTLLLWEEFWPQVVQLLRSASDKNGSALETFLIADPLAGNGSALIAITCIDHSSSSDSVDVQRVKSQAIGMSAPYRNYRDQSDFPRDICSFWPYPAQAQAHVPVVAPELPTLLFVSQRHDGTTPYKNAQSMAGWFKGRLLTREHDGHTLALNGLDRCVDEEVVDYLLDPVKARPDKTCH